LARLGGKGGEVKVWNVEKKQKAFSLPYARDIARSVAWSPDSRRLAAVVQDVGTSAQFSALVISECGAPDAFYEVESLLVDLTCVAWNPTGDRIAIAAGHEIRIANTGTWQWTRTLKGHAGQVWEVAWSPDGSRLASGARDGLVKVWDLDRDEEPLTFRGHAATVWSVAWSPCGQYVVSASQDGSIRFWDASQEARSGVLRGRLGVAWSPNGRWLAAWGEKEDTLELLDAATGELLREFEAPEHGGFVFDPKGTRVAGGGSSLKIWDCTSGRKVLEEITVEATWSLAWSPDDRMLAAVELGPVLRIWDLATREARALVLDLDDFGSLAWSPTSKLVAIAFVSQQVVVYDVESPEEVQRFRTDPRRSAWGWCGHFSIAWDPAGERLVAGSVEGAVVVWDVPSGAEVLRTRGHVANVFAVAWSPDGRRIASASDDHTVKI